MNRKQLENKFATYPDVVTLTDFRKILGGIGDSTARKLMREKRVEHYYIRNCYMISTTYLYRRPFCLALYA